MFASIHGGWGQLVIDVGVVVVIDDAVHGCGRQACLNLSVGMVEKKITEKEKNKKTYLCLLGLQNAMWLAFRFVSAEVEWKLGLCWQSCCASPGYTHWTNIVCMRGQESRAILEPVWRECLGL